ncbi:MAG TPA: N-acetylmuramoyl-L-alanine amidase, partial [Ferruginibacter sp.]|nr:N-acetylmuramoyl-L-alanine amidase [Ferruginibacter sp.]
RVNAMPGARLSVLEQPLYEIPDSLTNGVRGIYQGTFCIQSSDTFQWLRLPVKMLTSDSTVVTKTTENSLSVWRAGSPEVGITRGRLAHLEYGLGDDRLGGAKIGYLDSLVRLHLTGRVGDDWRVQLSPGRTAYIPAEHVDLLPKGVFVPSSLTNKIVAFGDSVYDYVEVPLSVRLPYQSQQLTNPSRLVLDIFGATNNTNWISQLNSLKEIKQIDYEQVADDQFRITLQLTHTQHWGHRLYYKGNTLVWQIKQQPRDLSLNKLVIAVDAGHGGTNMGAVGPTGVTEKELTLAVSLKLRDALTAAGARVIMTRETETFFDNKERILFYRDSTPDLLVSMHLNSSADPIRVGGTSTYYRSVGFRPLSQAIYQRMLSLGLKEYGNNGSFNFMLNSPTEYPNALVEMLFLSNPAEEMKILDPAFQQQIAVQVLNGIRDFLDAAKEDK